MNTRFACRDYVYIAMCYIVRYQLPWQPCNYIMYVTLCVQCDRNHAVMCTTHDDMMVY